MEMNWSRWFRCESSFGLLLVPNQPGIYALAEEIVEAAGPQSRRMLAVFEIEEAEDLVRSLSRMFSPSSEWSTRLAEQKCYLRYAVVPDPAERRSAAEALKNWLTRQRDRAAHVFEQQIIAPSVLEHRTESEPEEAEVKTVAETAVDRVTKSRTLSRMMP